MIAGSHASSFFSAVYLSNRATELLLLTSSPVAFLSPSMNQLEVSLPSSFATFVDTQKEADFSSLSLSGSIGTGLFVGTGSALRNGGPAGVLSSSSLLLSPLLSLSSRFSS